MATVRLQLRRGTSTEWDTANPTLAAGEIGIETDTNTFKFGDGQTAWNSLSYALSDTVDDYVLLSTKGVANGVASLDSSGFVPASQLPPLAKVTVSAVANEAARLALTAEAGDIAIQSDNGQSYVLSASPASTNANWKSLVGSEAVVDTVEASLVAGTGLDKTYDDAAGTITIDIDSTVATKTYADQAEADAVSTAAADATTKANAAQAAAISAAATDATTKANAAQAAASTALTNHEADTTSIHGIADTSILATTTGTQTLTNKTFTSPVINTPTGITKSDVGLSNVDNTSDADKPISLAALSALGAKAPLNSPALTGDATAVNLTLSGNLTVNGSTSTINSTTLTVQDKDIVLGQTSTPTDAAADNGGIILKGTTDKSIKYSLAKSAWDISENINIPGDKAVKINNIEVLTVSTVLGKALPGIVVGTSETQTLTNKTIDSPTIDTPTFTGTFTLPITTSIGNVSADEMQMLNGVTSNVQTQIDAKAPSASPTFTGTVTLPTATSIGSVSATELELLNGVTSNVQTQIDTKLASATAASTYAPLNSPTFTGTVTLPANTSIGDLSISELALLDGVTSNVQTQIDAKAPSASPTFTGTVALPATTSIGLVSATELELLNGVTSNVQTQIDAKAPSASPTFTGTVALPATTSIGLVSATELELLNGVTSNVQTQIDAKAPLNSPTFTGTVTLPANTISQSMMGDDSVGTNEIGGLAVTTEKIADSAVTTAKLADDSVTSGKIVAGTIVNSDINATAAIDWTKIAASSTVSATELGYLDGVTSAVQTQIDTKAPLASPTFTGTVSLPTGTVTSGMIADGTIVNADINASAAIALSKIASGTSGQIIVANSSGVPTWVSESGDVTISDTGVTAISAGVIVDADINASAAIAQSKISGLTSDLASKAPTASPTFTGTVSGITKTMVGLGNVDNTSDASKPISTATQTALDLKANKAAPTFTGTVTASNDLVVDGNLTVNGTTFNASSTSITIEDNMVQLAHQNAGNSVDLGLVVAYNDGAAKHAGLVRDVSDSKWKLFKGVTTEPSTTVDFTQGSLDDLKVAAFEATTVTPSSGIVFSDGTQTKEGIVSRTPIVSKTDSYTLSALTERDSLIEINKATAVTLTIPTDATIDYPIGTSIDILQTGAGQVTIAPVSGTVTVNATPGLKLRTTWSSATLFKRAANTWVVFGDLTA
jgi:hypothetical protein